MAKPQIPGFVVCLLTATVCLPLGAAFDRWQDLEVMRGQLQSMLIVLKNSGTDAQDPAYGPLWIDGQVVPDVTNLDDGFRERLGKLGKCVDYRILKVARYSAYEAYADVEITWEKGKTTERFLTMRSRKWPYLYSDPK